MDLAKEHYIVTEVNDQNTIDFIQKSINKIQTRLKESYPRKRTLGKIAQVIAYRYLIWPGCHIVIPPIDTEQSFKALNRYKVMDLFKFYSEYTEYTESIGLPSLENFIVNSSRGWAILLEENND